MLKKKDERYAEFGIISVIYLDANWANLLLSPGSAVTWISSLRMLVL